MLLSCSPVHDAQLLTQLMKCKRHAGVYPHEDISSTPIALQMHLIMAHSRKVRCNITYFYSLIKLASSAEVEVRWIIIYNTIQYDLAYGTACAAKVL